MVKKVLKGLIAYMALVGLVTFPLFIMEESHQVLTFGTWPAQDAKRWDLVMTGTSMMEKNLIIMDRVNTYFGWIQPLAWLSYRAYHESAEFYTEALRAKVFAYAPELFVGEHVQFRFKPNSISTLEDGSYAASNGNVRVLYGSPPGMVMQDVKGVLMQDGNLLTIDTRK